MGLFVFMGGGEGILEGIGAGAIPPTDVVGKNGLTDDVGKAGGAGG